ncbi:nucleoside 2-deoxyribosyltransferase [Salinispora sp. H7-4]|uniref:nucleoside 2-deoxyribosyltransferase n=1 Tax=Salinispora sp. H7-4 TaxID=2748321 RepID=UPI001C550516|nr:nucleoside 2-deoxyribosyltransferase [Salinispora sp. H7-4]
MSEIPTVFIGGPFKGLVQATTGLVDPAHQRRYERLIEHFTQRGWRTLSAHRQEGWGGAMVAADVCTARDFAWMQECDLFVAFPGHPVSPGTHVEIGWASALGRPTVLLREPGVEPAALIAGLSAVAPVTYLDYEDGLAFPTALDAAVRQLTDRVGVG